MNVVMKVGTAQLEITPQPGIELAGFAVRPQPSTDVLDGLYVRALYLENGKEQLLWLYADLLAVNQALADAIRARVERETGLASSRVLVSTTHTHSGPATFDQNGTGRTDPEYVMGLAEQFQKAAVAALANTESCALVTAEGVCRLGLDRRKRASAHVDPRVGSLGWRRPDGTFKAVFLTYSMHPVCLRDSYISADWPGAAGRALSQSLPGEPMTIVATGACGNINPPKVGVMPNQTYEWGRAVAECVREKLLQAQPDTVLSGQDVISIGTAAVDLPIDPWGVCEIEKYAAGCFADPGGRAEFGDKFEQAVQSWRSSMVEFCRRGEPPYTRAILGLVSLGKTTILTVNAEVFSRFSDLVGPHPACSVYTVGCTNGMLGYLPTKEAYDEGAYEVSWSALFYNMPRIRKGGFELLAERARQLLDSASSLGRRLPLIHNQPSCLGA
jgi:hypothetical protein